MLTTLDYLLLLFFGMCGAFLSGFLGVGGGMIYIPVLDYFLRRLGLQDEMLVKAILANSLFTIIFSGSVSSWKQYRIGNFYPREILLTALPGMATALSLTWLIRSGDWYSKQLFNYVFALMLLVIAVRMFSSKQEIGVEKEAPNWKYRITGLFAGIITAFSGLGGGVVMTPLFTDWMKQPFKKAGSISNGVIPLFAITMGIFNLSVPAGAPLMKGQIGLIFLPLLAPMILATFVFAPLGVKIAQKTKPGVIRLIFAIFTGIVFTKLIVEIVQHP